MTGLYGLNGACENDVFRAFDINLYEMHRSCGTPHEFIQGYGIDNHGLPSIIGKQRDASRKCFLPRNGSLQSTGPVRNRLVHGPYVRAEVEQQVFLENSKIGGEWLEGYNE